MSEAKVGALFEGRYQLLSLLGEGGMGAVYEAIDTHRENLPCAVKVIKATKRSSEAYLLRLEREREVMEKLRHAHIVEIFDVASSARSEEAYLVMELLKGLPFDEWLSAQREREGGVSVGRLIRLACQTLDALEHAHQRGVVHRDLKPENLFVCEDEHGCEQIKLLDFGVAKDLEHAVHLTEGLDNAMIGTPRYMSPEQVTSSAPVSPASDLYSFGLVLYEALMGVHPFESIHLKTASEVRGLPVSFRMSWHHVNSEIPPLVELPTLWDLLRDLFDKEPTSRLADARALRAKLSAWMRAHPKESALLTPVQRSQRFYASLLKQEGSARHTEMRQALSERSWGSVLHITFLRPFLWPFLRPLLRAFTPRARILLKRTVMWCGGGVLSLIACALLWRALGYPEFSGAMVYLAYPLMWALESLEQLLGVAL